MRRITPIYPSEKTNPPDGARRIPALTFPFEFPSRVVPLVISLAWSGESALDHHVQCHDHPLMSGAAADHTPPSMVPHLLWFARYAGGAAARWIRRGWSGGLIWPRWVLVATGKGMGDLSDYPNAGISQIIIIF